MSSCYQLHREEKTPKQKQIIISSYDGSNSDAYSKFAVYRLFTFFKKKGYANYALFGVREKGNIQVESTPLGLYEKPEVAKKEMNEIMQALQQGHSHYQLKYNSPIEVVNGKFKLCSTSSSFGE